TATVAVFAQEAFCDEPVKFLQAVFSAAPPEPALAAVEGGVRYGPSIRHLSTSLPAHAVLPVPVVGSVGQGQSHDQRYPLSPIRSSEGDVDGNEARQAVGMPPGVLPLRSTVFVLGAEVAHAESLDLREDNGAERGGGRR